jgi:tetratricopeptide (TPR) repeat protein
VDFEKATEKDPQNDLAFDRLGLTYESNGEEDKAIRACTQEMALNRFGKRRLADAYCNIGFRHQQQKDFAAAMAAYQKSTESSIADDKTCPIEPFETMVAIYTIEARQYDKAWETVHQAQKVQQAGGSHPI